MISTGNLKIASGSSAATSSIFIPPWADAIITGPWGTNLNINQTIFQMPAKGEPELTDPFNLLINIKLRMLWNWNFFYLKEHFYGNIVS